MSSRPRYVPELDGLRAVAILPVIAYHAWSYAEYEGIGRAVTLVAKRGWLGVDVFFAISGFLIAGILLDSRDSSHYFKTFYIRRTLRIFPLYYAVMTAVLVMGLLARALGMGEIGGAGSIANIWWNYLYLSNFGLALHSHDYVPLDITWSLAVEEQFYLVFPFVVRFSSERQLRTLLITAILAAPIVRAISAYVFPHGALAAYALPFCRMDALAIGCLTAVWARAPDLTALRRWAACAPLLWVVAVVVAATYKREQMVFIVAGYGLVSAATAATIAKFKLGGWGALRSMLRLRPVVYVGKISYGLYLLHLFARAAVDRLGAAWLEGYKHDLGLATARALAIFALSLVAASLSWRWFEEPLLKLKERFAGSAGQARSEQPQPAVAAIDS